MRAFDPASFFFAPFGESRASLSDSVDTLLQGARALLSGLGAVNEELARFTVERLKRHMSVASAFLEGPWPAGAFVQMTDYILESAEVWDEEQTRLAGIMADALTESLLAEEVVGRVVAPALPYSPWLERHDDKR
jgi:hypothetical protein